MPTDASDSGPLIYAPRSVRHRLGWRGRLLAAGVGAGCLAVLLAALYAPPDPSGVGTHTALGMAPCSFEQRSGVPCPTCGMTTAYAHFVRGRPLASFYVQPMGALLALATIMAAWTGLYIALTGRPAHRLLQRLPARYYLAPILALAVTAWAWKMYIHARGIDGWSNP